MTFNEKIVKGIVENETLRNRLFGVGVVGNIAALAAGLYVATDSYISEMNFRASRPQCIVTGSYGKESLVELRDDLGYLIIREDKDGDGVVDSHKVVHLKKGAAIKEFPEKYDRLLDWFKH